MLLCDFFTRMKLLVNSTQGLDFLILNFELRLGIKDWISVIGLRSHRDRKFRLLENDKLTHDKILIAYALKNYIFSV